MELDCHKWNGSLRTVSFDLWQCNSNYGSVLPFNCRTWSFPRIFKTLSKKTHPRNESLWIKDLFKYHRWSITTRESHPQSQQWKIRNMRKTFSRQSTIMCDEKHLGLGRLRLICPPRIALCCLTHYMKVHVDSVHLA